MLLTVNPTGAKHTHRTPTTTLETPQLLKWPEREIETTRGNRAYLAENIRNRAENPLTSITIFPSPPISGSLHFGSTKRLPQGQTKSKKKWRLSTPAPVDPYPKRIVGFQIQL